ncbi:MAG: hypothetical protein ACSHXZ_15055, partial [Gammaproteobacteria bacterium]
ARVNSNEMATVELPERATGGFMGRGGETDADWHSRASEAASEAVRDVSARLSGERDAATDELNETKLKMADLESRAETTSNALQFLADAHSVYEQLVLDREGAKVAVSDFHKAYIAAAPDIPKSIREIIDDKLLSMGKHGFEQMELDREEAKREREADERAAGLERLAQWEARSPDRYSLSKTGAEHREILRLIKESTSEAQYSRFRTGDLSAIDHITNNPVFSRQLLAEVESHDRAKGFELSREEEDRMRDARDYLKSNFKAEFERGNDHEHSR